MPRAAGTQRYQRALQLYKKLHGGGLTDEESSSIRAQLRALAAPPGTDDDVGMGTPADAPEVRMHAILRPPLSSSCTTGGSFVMSNVQKIVRNVLSPYTQHRGIVLFHGVGVGKTCTAIQVAESFKNVFAKPALILGPAALKSSFRNQIHDSQKPANMQCTGDTYLMEKSIDTNYVFAGYEAFARYVERLEQTFAGPAFAAKLADVFSDQVMIIDEVQNLRRLQNKNKTVSKRLQQVLMHAKGIRLVLLTATPLYNDVDELLFLMELMYMNDRNDVMLERVRRTNFLTIDDESKALLQNFASRYVSYMRGENLSFPVRLYPPHAKKQFGLVPLVFVPLSKIQGQVLKERSQNSAQSDEDDEDDGADREQVLAQASDIVYPCEERIGRAAFQHCFVYSNGTKSKKRATFHYNPDVVREVGQFLSPRSLSLWSPKISIVVQSAVDSRGVVVVYSRYIHSGLLPLALALEHRGFDNISGNLGHGLGRPNEVVGRYALILGDASYSEQNLENILRTINSSDNTTGRHVKVVLISGKAAEGFDFKFVRELHVLEPWYNMSRIEQIIGRGVRNCSHALLPPEQRNCTIYLYVAGTPKDPDAQTYKLAEHKQGHISRIERIIKENAFDCHLNLPVLTIKNAPSVSMLDSRGRRVKVSRNDQDFSKACDYAKCDFKCARDHKEHVDAVDVASLAPFFIEPDVKEYTQTILRCFETKLAITERRLREYIRENVERRGVQYRDAITTLAIARVIQQNRVRLPESGKHGTIVRTTNGYTFRPSSSTMSRSVVSSKSIVVDVPILSGHDTTKTVHQVLSELKKRKDELVSAMSDAPVSVLIDHVIDYMPRRDFLVLAQAATAGKVPAEVFDSLERGAIVFPGCKAFYDPFTKTYLDSKGNPASGLLATDAETLHANAVLPHDTKAYVHLKQSGVTSLKLADKSRGGVVCNRFSQLKNAKLLDMIRELVPAWNLSQTSELSRCMLCDMYDVACRITGRLLRPGEQLVQSSPR